MIKKTKVHALSKPEYQKQFPQLRQEAIGNNEADRYVGKAKYSFYNANHILISQLLPKREEQYAKLLRSIHNVITRVHIASQQVRATQAYKMDNNLPIATTYVLHQLPPRHCELESQTFEFKITRELYKIILPKVQRPLLGSPSYSPGADSYY